MKQQEEITFQTLANNDDIQLGYLDNEIAIVDSIQQFTQINSAHVTMNAIVICTRGKVQAQMNGIQMELHQNQVAVVPQNVTVTDVMVSPDFDLKGLFLTNRILRSFLREKIFKYDDRPEAGRFWNYPYRAIEEVLANAVYHKSYRIAEPITVVVTPEAMTISSLPGPERSITDAYLAACRMIGLHYRNRRIGDFLKELLRGEQNGNTSGEQNGTPCRPVDPCKHWL